MVTYSVDLQDRDYRAFLRHISAGALRRAIEEGINDTLKQIQTAERNALGQRLTLRRRQWAERSMKIGREDFANFRRGRHRGRISVETPGDPERSDVLAQHEEGGKKRPRDGGRLSVPVREQFPRAKVVPKAKRPKAFEFKLHGQGPKAEVYIGKNRTWLVRMPGGVGGIYQRKGNKGQRRRRLASDVTTRRVRDLGITTLYRFTPEAHLESRLGFIQTADATYRARFEANLAAALERAVQARRARDRGDGTLVATSDARRIAAADVLDRGRVPTRRR